MTKLLEQSKRKLERLNCLQRMNYNWLKKWKECGSLGLKGNKFSLSSHKMMIKIQLSSVIMIYLQITFLYYNMTIQLNLLTLNTVITTFVLLILLTISMSLSMTTVSQLSLSFQYLQNQSLNLIYLILSSIILLDIFSEKIKFHLIQKNFLSLLMILTLNIYCNKWIQLSSSNKLLIYLTSNCLLEHAYPTFIGEYGPSIWAKIQISALTMLHLLTLDSLNISNLRNNCFKIFLNKLILNLNEICFFITKFELLIINITC